MAKFTVVNADCWQALYVDGELYEQHHEVDLVQALKQHGVDIEEIAAYDDPYLDDYGDYPDKLEEVTPDAD